MTGFLLLATIFLLAGIIAVPLVMGGAAGLDAAQTGLLIASCLFVSGLSTILQSVGVPFFGSQLPLVQGVFFASVATMLTTSRAATGCPGSSVRPSPPAPSG